MLVFPGFWAPWPKFWAGISARMTPGCPRDIRPKDFLLGLIFRSWYAGMQWDLAAGMQLIGGEWWGRTPKGSYSPKGRSRHLLETAFSEPLLRTLLRTFFQSFTVLSCKCCATLVLLAQDNPKDPSVLKVVRRANSPRGDVLVFIGKNRKTVYGL